MEDLVLLNGLKAYDQKKGTAVVEAATLPETVENRTYLKKSADKTVETVWVKDVEVATEYDVQNYVDYNQPVTITDKIYGTYGGSGSVGGDLARYFENGKVKYGYTLTVQGTRVYYYDGTKLYDINMEEVDYTDKPIDYTRINTYRIGDKQSHTLSEIAMQSDLGNYIPKTEKARPNGVATLDSNGLIPMRQLPIEALSYQGTWDATTPLPTTDKYGNPLVSGDFYIVSVSSADYHYEVGDWILYNGSSFDLIETTNDVHTVNGKRGAVVLYATDIERSDTNAEDVDTSLTNLETDMAKTVWSVNSVLPVNHAVTIDASNIKDYADESTKIVTLPLTKVDIMKNDTLQDIVLKLANEAYQARGNKGEIRDENAYVYRGGDRMYGPLTFAQPRYDPDRDGTITQSYPQGLPVMCDYQGVNQLSFNGVAMFIKHYIQEATVKFHGVHAVIWQDETVEGYDYRPTLIFGGRVAMTHPYIVIFPSEKVHKLLVYKDDQLIWSMEVN